MQRDPRAVAAISLYDYCNSRLICSSGVIQISLPARLKHCVQLLRDLEGGGT